MAVDQEVLGAFHRAAERVPAYRQILCEHGVDPKEVRDLPSFLDRVPVLNKHATFQRFAIHELCVDGELGLPESVLTSSGHSGVFSFGLYDASQARADLDRVDRYAEMLFQAQSKRTLFINCLPMGVSIHTRLCTVGQTSVREDIAAALIAQFARYYDQLILGGEAAFLKRLLEFARSQGIDWRKPHVHVLLGEEPLAENARKYIEGIIGTDVRTPEHGMVISTMGVAELGMFLFVEAPPVGVLPLLRRVLHEDQSARAAVLGGSPRAVPMIFTYDPKRVFVETNETDGLIVTMLEEDRRIPMIRYATGDKCRRTEVPVSQRPPLAAQGVAVDLLAQMPILAIEGRGQFAVAGETPIYPEQIKEGIYADQGLAATTTANFRLRSGKDAALVRIQLMPGVAPSSKLRSRFSVAITDYVDGPLSVTCERYGEFKNGMALDYERKFSYVEQR